MTSQPPPVPEDDASVRLQDAALKEVVRSGEAVVARLRTLTRDRQARHVTLLTREGEELARVSLGLGVVAGGLVLMSAPAVAALGVLAALATHAVVLVTRDPARPGFIDEGPPSTPQWTADTVRPDRPSSIDAVPI